MDQHDVIIVGAGLSGLYTAYLLSKQKPKQKIKIIEVRDRLGGRLYSPNENDMGATWSWPQSDVHLKELSQILNISTFSDAHDQIRFLGGTQQLVTKLYKLLEPTVDIQLNTLVHSINYNTDQIQLNAMDLNANTSKLYKTKSLVLAIPPRLILSKITFEPPLPKNKITAMTDTPTWMSRANKVFLEYTHPFWRQHQSLPLFISNSVMIYDASQKDEKYAICAFHTGRPISLNEKYIQSLIAKLTAKFGSQIKENINVNYHNWYEDEWTCDELSRKQMSHCMDDMHSFGNALLREPVQNIYFASTETEMEYGHMEGALISARRVVDQILISG